MMKFLAALKQKMVTKFSGELITDFGLLPMDDKRGTEIGLALRRHPGKRPHLQVRMRSASETEWFRIACSRQWADQFEKVAHEMRKQLDAHASGELKG